MNGRRAKAMKKQSQRLYDTIYGQEKKLSAWGKCWKFFKKYIIGVKVRTTFRMPFKSFNRIFKKQRVNNAR